MKEISNDSISAIDAELCYCIETKIPLNESKIELIKWLLKSPFMPLNLRDSSEFISTENQIIIEIGPR